MGNTKVLNEVTISRRNNLNIMRFIAAIMVIVCHSVPICYGENKEDVVGIWTNGMINLGGIAVGVFFVTGGYLIAKSSENKQKGTLFFWARINRILPSLIAVILICTFLLGPILTKLSVSAYFRNIDTYKYLLNSILIPVHYLPGVFENNIYSGVVNGSLWTLPIESMCYIGCFVAYKLGFFDSKRYTITIPIISLLSIVFFVFLAHNIFWPRIVRPIILYYIGIGYYVFRDRIQIDMKYGVLATILFILSIALKLPNIGMLIFFPYMIYFIAYGLPGRLCEFGKKYEISYGMYLWGWPIQQVLSSFGGVFCIWYVNALTATIVAMLVGLLNHIVIENNTWIKRRRK